MKVFKSAMERQSYAKLENEVEFHWTDLAARGLNEDTARKFIRRWEKAGLIRMVRRDGSRKVFSHADRPPPAPLDPTAERTAEGNMWRSMRQLGTFSPTDVAVHSNAGGIEVSVQQARAYIRMLLGTNYLRVKQTAIHGKREAVYQLIANSGPVAPRRRRIAGVFDPNTGTFIPEEAPA